MSKSANKSNSRQAFAEVFEEHTRRFSPLELLGLSSEGLAVPIENRQVLVPHSLAQVLRSDRTAQDQTADPKHSGQTVRSSSGQTVKPKKIKVLGPDSPAQVVTFSSGSVILAPLQWAVWQALQEDEATHRVTSYRQLAKRTQSTIDGVRKAVKVLRKEGGITNQETVRSSQEQGFRVALSHEVVFHKGTLNEARGVLKRGLRLGQTTDSPSSALGPDRLLSVCLYIKQTDIENLLRILPAEWSIRERTLTEIATQFPTMTAIEFRRSLLHLVGQARASRQAIQHPNAWVKAAFEKNGGPLITERDIDARLDYGPQTGQGRVPVPKEDDSDDAEVLQWYMAISQEDKEAIEQAAHERLETTRLLVSADKHAGLLEQARLECAREMFHAHKGRAR
jgi:hypothetical protein